MNINDKVKLFKRSENTNQWQELRDDYGNPYKGIVKELSYSGDKEPIFALVSFKENESLLSEELLSINSPCFKLVRY